MKALAASGEKGLLTLIMATHAGMTPEEFRKTVRDWLASARHPKFKRPYNELVYKPMLELLAYLRANGFKTFIVSGGGIEFMRPMTEAVYGIPPEQVVGSSIKTKYEIQDGKPVLMRLAEMEMPGGQSRWSAGKDLSWEPLRIERVCEVKYDHMQGTRFRHAAIFLRWRPDKRPAECTYEQLDVVAPYELAKVFGAAAPRRRSGA